MMTISAISSSLLPISASSTILSAQNSGQSQSSTTAENTSAATADSYTPGVQSGKAAAIRLNNLIASLGAQYYASSGASSSTQSENSYGLQDINDAAAAELAKNQTISSAPDVRIILGSALPGDPVLRAWTQLSNSVFAGDLSGAQAALTNYTQALQNSNYGMSSLSAPTAQFMNDLTGLGTAIQGGDLSQVKTAYLTAQHNVPQGTDAFYGAYESGDTAAVASLTQETVANITGDLVALGYTPANAAVEANAMEIGSIVQGQTQYAASGQANVPSQSIIGLAKVAAGDVTSSSSSNNSTTSDSALSIYAALFSATTIDSMMLTLTALDATYGIGNSSGNTGSTTAGSSGNASGSADVNAYA